MRCITFALVAVFSTGGRSILEDDVNRGLAQRGGQPSRGGSPAGPMPAARRAPNPNLH